MIKIQRKEIVKNTTRLLVRRTPTAGKPYDKIYIYIPSDVARDSRFPFKADEQIIIKIDSHKKRLVIEKA